MTGLGLVVRNAAGRFIAHRPCVCCGVRCCSQLEFMHDNDDQPWRYCSGCDPGLWEEDGYRCPCGGAGG